MSHRNIYDLNIRQYVETLNQDDLNSISVTKNPDYFKYIPKGNLKKIEGIEIPSELLRYGNNPDFRFIVRKNRLYISNGIIQIPCSTPVINKNYVSVSVFYLPTELNEVKDLEIDFLFSKRTFKNGELEISLDSGIFYRDVFGVLSDSEIMDLVSILTNICNEDFYNVTIHLSKGIKNVERRIKLFHRLNLLGILSVIHLMRIGFVPFDKEKILKVFFIDYESYNTLSQSTVEFFGMERILDCFSDYFKDIEQILKIFEFQELVQNHSYLSKEENQGLQLLKRLEYHEHFSELSDKKEYEYKNKYRLYKQNKYYNSFGVIKGHGNMVKNNLREIENKLRLEYDLNVVGSLVSESILFKKISEYFEDLKVISQGSPKWLGRQHLDIYFPRQNIGIEYQGVQHFEPVDFFGGEEGLRLTKLRDKKKKRICKENGCHLIEVLPGYDINEVINDIEKVIEQETC